MMKWYCSAYHSCKSFVVHVSRTWVQQSLYHDFLIVLSMFLLCASQIVLICTICISTEPSTKWKCGHFSQTPCLHALLAAVVQLSLGYCFQPWFSPYLVVNRNFFENWHVRKLKHNWMLLMLQAPWYHRRKGRIAASFESHWASHSASGTGSQGLALPLMLHFSDNWPLNIRTVWIYTEKQPNDIDPVCVLIMCLPSTNVCKSALPLSTLTKAREDSCLLHLLKKFRLPAQIAKP